MAEYLTLDSTAIASMIFDDNNNPNTHLLVVKCSKSTVVDDSPYVCEAAKTPAPQTWIEKGGININIPAITVRCKLCRIALEISTVSFFVGPQRG